MNKTNPGFFARKFNVDEENLLNIFKTPKIWGALLGEMIGTMMLTMLFLNTFGMFRVDFVPLFLMFAALCAYLVAAKLSGANLNPLVTAGMMATRRMSAIRGVLYILAQVVGAWLGSLILNAFRIGSGSANGYPGIVEATSDSFWVLALMQLLGAIIIAFCFARALRYTCKNTLTFAFTVTSSLVLVCLLGIIISQNYFGLADSLVFNPASALMYGILPTTAENFGALASAAGLALAAYVVFPMVGGVIGFYLSDLATRLAGHSYQHEAICAKNDE